jgi:hypothetical protein
MSKANAGLPAVPLETPDVANAHPGYLLLRDAASIA